MTAAEKAFVSAFDGFKLEARLNALARFSAEPEKLTRLTLTPEHRAAADCVAGWMREAGMSVRIDATGSVVGRYEGLEAGGTTLLLGSHIDTVRDAGKYDGNYGVVCAIAVVEELVRANTRLPFAIEVLAFADEEGVRFPSALTSSRAVAGVFDPASLEDRDRDRISRREALIAFGCNPDAIDAEARDPDNILAYLEVHIEQGPVLESEGLSAGVVTAISGATRGEIVIVGEAGHSGTLPMSLRRDALTAAARLILEIESIGHSRRDLVATVGQIVTPNGAVNIVPGEVRMSFDVRSPSDEVRQQAMDRIRAAVDRLASERGVQANLTVTYDMASAPCDRAIIEAIGAAMKAGDCPDYRLPSGAGHDGLSFRGRMPIGMIFVRCRKGVSHNPAEYASPGDMQAGARILYQTVLNLGNAVVPDAVSHMGGQT